MKIALVGLNLTICEVQAPATIDGGDVLYAGGVIFVGLSRLNFFCFKMCSKGFFPS